MIRWAVKLAVLSTMFVATTLASPPSVPHVPAVSPDDRCLAWIIDNEARGEPVRGQRAIYDVVKHRMAERKLTACEVVKQKGQFSGYHRGMNLKADEDMLHRLENVRIMKPVVSSASYFHNKQVRPTWAASMKKVLTVGNHIFFATKQKEKQK